MYTYCKRGFTLTEIMLSIVILAFVLLTIMGIFGAAISGIKKGENYAVAVALAQQVIETYRNDLELDFDEYSLATYTEVPVCPGKINGINFKADVSISPATGPIISGGNIQYSTDRIRKLTVIVTWKEVGGKREFKLTTYVNNLY